MSLWLHCHNLPQNPLGFWHYGSSAFCHYDKTGFGEFWQRYFRHHF